MGQAQQLCDHTAHWIGRGLPWILVIGLSAGIAYTINAAVTRALPTPTSSDAVLAGAPEDEPNPCALDVDGALYGDYDWWLPAGRSTVCRAESYPGLPGRRDLARQASRQGPLRATVTFAGPTEIRIDLYCQTGTRQQRTASGDFFSAADARVLYAQACVSGVPAP